MPEAGGIITHAVGFTGNVAGEGVVAVVTLMDAIQSEEVGGRAGGSS